MIRSDYNLNSTIHPGGTYASQKPEQAPAGEKNDSPAADTVQISRQGHDRLEASENRSSANPTAEELSPEQKQEVEKLKKRDLEVKAHENAHASAGAGIVQGGAKYEYQRGSDGRMYAVGGEVKIDTSREKNPEDTIRKMQQVRQAALAPSQPSAQDRSVAAQASEIEAEARVELANKNSEETSGNQEDPLNAANPQLSATADPTHNIPNTGRRIDITV